MAKSILYILGQCIKCNEPKCTGYKEKGVKCDFLLTLDKDVDNTWCKTKVIIPHPGAYNAEKNLTPLYVGENIPNSRGLGKRSYTNYKITHTPNKSQMVDPLELTKSW